MTMVATNVIMHVTTRFATNAITHVMAAVTIIR